MEENKSERPIYNADLQKIISIIEGTPLWKEWKKHLEINHMTKEQISEALKVKKVEFLAQGFRANNYVVHTDFCRFRVKIRHPDWLSLNFPERFISLTVKSHQMWRDAQAPPDPVPLGLFISIPGKECIAISPQIPKESLMFSIYQFEDGEKIRNCGLMFGTKSQKLSERDTRDIEAVVSQLIKHHQRKYEETETGEARLLWNHNLTHILEVFQRQIVFGDHPFLHPEDYKELYSLLFDSVIKWRNREDRMAALHGDFRPSNVFVRDNLSVFFIDWLHFKWGDPALDVAWWIMEDIFNGYIKDDNRYFSRAEIFLSTYAQAVNDKEIFEAMCPGIALKTAVLLNPTFIEKSQLEAAKGFFRYAIKILKAMHFIKPR